MVSTIRIVISFGASDAPLGWIAKRGLKLTRFPKLSMRNLQFIAPIKELRLCAIPV